MRSSKFFDLLRTLDIREIQEFDQYLQFFHKRKKIAIQVYTYVKKFALSYKLDNDKLKKEYAYQKIFAKEQFNYRKLVDSLSDLHLVLKEFLISNRIKNEIFEQDFLLAKIYKERRMWKEFHQQIESMSDDLKKRKQLDMWGNLQLMQLKHFQYYSSDLEKFNERIDEVKDAMAYLDKFYIGAKFRYSCELINRQNILQNKYEIHLLDPILDLFRSKQLEKDLYHDFYFLNLQLLQSKKEESYRKLESLFYKKNHILSKREQLLLLLYLVNITAHKIRMGETQYYNNTFELYQFGLTHKLLVEDGNFPTEAFNNIISVAVQLRKLSWVKKFVEDWSSYLKDEVRENTKQLAIARILFEEAKFDQAWALLGTINFTDISYTFQARTLRLMCYLELDQPYNLTYDDIRSFDAQVRRNKVVNQSLKIGILNFLKILKWLLKRESKKKLMAEMKELKPIFHKHWLLRKIKDSSY